MSYIGRGLQSGAFRQLDSIESSFDGSTTGFTMQVNSTNVIMGDANQILLSLGGVIQKPGTDFTISSSTLTFTTAPATGTSFFAILLGSDNGGTVTPTDGSVTGDKVASTGAFTIGAAGTASSLAGIPFYNGDTTSIYTHDVSGTDSTATHNTAYGITAMDAITTGDANTAIGWSAGSALNTGTQNTIVGKGALASASSAGSNTAIGWNAAYAVTTGTTAITAIGDGAYNSAGDTEAHNIAIGVNAMAAGSLAGAEYNIAIGNYALDALTSGDSNLGIGYNAGTAITTGTKNVSVGNSSHIAVTEGFSNTAMGYFAASTLTTGDYNNYFGEDAGKTLTTGNHNTGIGYQAGGAEATMTGSQNTCLGNYAGFGITSGSTNTIVGYDAGQNISSGGNNTVIGNAAGITGSPGGNIVTGSNNLHLGDENVSSCQIQTDWTVASDQRDKTDFTALDIGLDFVNNLKPYTYKWDKRIKYVSKENRSTVDLDTITHDGTHKEDWLDLGFKAQDVEALEKAAGYKIADKTNLTTSLTEDGKQYGIKYSNFVPILVKAVQELSAKVKVLEDA